MGITLNNSTGKEAIPGLELGTLTHDSGKAGTYSFNYTNQPSYLSIAGNKLSLATDWFLDFETKKLLTLNVTHDKGLVSQYSPQSLTFPTSIPIKFTADSGEIYTDNVQVTISDQNETISITPVKFKQNQYGVVLAEINTNPNTSEAIFFEGPSCFEISGNKLKLKEDYFYSETGAIFKWKGNNSSEQYNMQAKNDAFNIKLITKSKYEPADTNDYGKVLLTQDSYRASIFGSSNVETTAVITLTPTQFYDKTVGSIIGKINYSGSENVEFSLETTPTDPILEISGTNLKLKADYYYDENTGRITKKDFFGKKLADISDLHITATDKDTSKKISTEKISISELTSSAFGSSNVLDKDESYTFVTDIKYVDATTPRNKEFQKLISNNHWELKNNETISYAFLGPGASYDSTKSDIKEFSGLVAVSDAFKAAAKSAFDIISSYIGVNFQEITESGDVTGDFRLGIANKDAFAMDLKFGAYSQGVTNYPKGGNIFFNGTVDKNGNGTVDYNEADQVKKGTWHFATFLHEIGHSLGLKHPFEDLSGGTSKTSEMFGDQFDQYRYSLMSYTPIIDQKTFADYEGITLNTKYGSGPYYPDTPMLYDVMALQEMYGTKSNSTGNDTYAFAKDAPPFKTIYDTGGTDTLDLSQIAGGASLDLSGNKISIIGSDYLRPWKNEDGKATSTYGDYQGSSMSIISGTDIEKVLLPDGASTITTGSKSTFFVGKADAPINLNINSSQAAVKSSGNADDTVTLNQTATKWGSDVQARNMGNAGKGATSSEIIKMSDYLKHDISLDLKEGIDTLNGTSGNDALFLQNFTTTGDSLWYADSGSSDSTARLLGINKINLLEGNNFLDLTSTTTSLASEKIDITSGSGNDVLWLSDADETIDSGAGDDQITLNGGSDNLKTGIGKDIITLSSYKGTLIIQDFDTTKDKFDFKASSDKVSATGNKITMQNSLGDYVITLTNNPDLSDLSAFSTFV